MNKKIILQPNIGTILDAAKRNIIPWNDDVEAEVRRAGKHYLKRLRKCHSAEAHGTAAQKHGRIYWAIEAPADKLIGMLLGMPRRCNTFKTRPQRTFTLDEVKRLSAQINLRKSTGEPITATAHIKSDGGTRITARYGLRSRACNRIVTDLLQATWGESRYEYARTGRGPHKAIRTVTHAIQHGGVKWIGETDLKDCADSEVIARGIPI